MNKTRIAVSMALEQPFKRHVAIFAGIQDYAAKRDDWQLIVDDWADWSLPTARSAAPFDGLLGRISRLGALRARRLGLPAVNVHFSAAHRDQLPGVFPDFTECGRLRAERFLVRGYSHFGVLAHAKDQAALLEAESFEQTVRAANCQRVDRLVLPATRAPSRLGVGDSDLTDFAEWRRAMRRIDDWIGGWRLPVGLFIYDIGMARVVIQKCQARGLRVPEDVAVIAGWNEEIQCECAEPTISSLELPYERIGWEAAELLNELIERSRSSVGRRGKKREPSRSEPVTRLLPPVGIVERQSTDCHAVGDDLVRRALGFMALNLRKPIGIDEIAETLAVSRGTLTSRFRRAVGRTVHEELQRLRVELAKRELAGTDAAIRSVADAVGFGSVRTLNKAFGTAVGCTPTSYRRETRPRR